MRNTLKKTFTFTCTTFFFFSYLLPQITKIRFHTFPYHVGTLQHAIKCDSSEMQTAVKHLN